MGTFRVLIACLAILACIGLRGIDAAVISGVVVDADGKPIDGARIDHTGERVVVSPTRFAFQPTSGEIRSASDGRFEATTEKPAIVIRKPGFESQRIFVRGDAKVRIVLTGIGTRPICEEKMPRIRTRPANDIDYIATWTYIDTKEGPKGILSGHGYLQSFGAPLDWYVWNSREYLEVMYEDGVIDARGHMAGDNYWRSQTVFGASSDYSRVNAATARILDCIMDQNRLKRP